MSKEKIDLIVDGGSAVAGASLGQTLGPLRINIKDVIAKINEKTSAFKGMKVPVKLMVDKDTKAFDVTVGSPAVSELIKKELSAEKGSAQPHIDKIGNLAIEQIIKIAKMKKDSMIVNSLKAAVKNVAGSCGQMGVLIESKEPKDVVKDINSGLFDKEIKAEGVEFSAEKKKQLEEGLNKVKEEIKKRLEKEKAAEEAKAAAAAKPAEEAKPEEAKPEEAKAAEAKSAEKGKPEEKKAEARPAKEEKRK